MDSYKLENVDAFLDFGVQFDHKLRFNLHIEHIVENARSVLGFIKGRAREFADPYATKRLYTRLGRLVLDYRCHFNPIESVQEQFRFIALRNLSWDPHDHLQPYANRLLLISLPREI